MIGLPLEHVKLHAYQTHQIPLHSTQFLLYSVDIVTAIVVLIAWSREALKEEALDDLP